MSVREKAGFIGGLLGFVFAGLVLGLFVTDWVLGPQVDGAREDAAGCWEHLRHSIDARSTCEHALWSAKPRIWVRLKNVVTMRHELKSDPTYPGDNIAWWNTSYDWDHWSFVVDDEELCEFDDHDFHELAPLWCEMVKVAAGE